MIKMCDSCGKQSSAYFSSAKHYYYYCVSCFLCLESDYLKNNSWTLASAMGFRGIKMEVKNA